MTYYDLITSLKECALLEPNIKFAGSKDIYELNALSDLTYNIFYIVPEVINVNEEQLSASLVLYYISRWDETEENQLEEQSAGILALTNIINRFSNNFPDVEVDTPYSMTPFYEKFKDMCTGVFARVTIKIPNILGTCSDNL